MSAPSLLWALPHSETDSNSNPNQSATVNSNLNSTAGTPFTPAQAPSPPPAAPSSFAQMEAQQQHFQEQFPTAAPPPTMSVSVTLSQPLPFSLAQHQHQHQQQQQQQQQQPPQHYHPQLQHHYASAHQHALSAEPSASTSVHSNAAASSFPSSSVLSGHAPFAHPLAVALGLLHQSGQQAHAQQQQLQLQQLHQLHPLLQSQPQLQALAAENSLVAAGHGHAAMSTSAAALWPSLAAASAVLSPAGIESDKGAVPEFNAQLLSMALTNALAASPSFSSAQAAGLSSAVHEQHVHPPRLPSPPTPPLPLHQPATSNANLDWRSSSPVNFPSHPPPPPPAHLQQSSSSQSSMALGARRKVACQPCALGKASCTGGRPCDRCVRLNRIDKCVDRVKSVKMEKTAVARITRKVHERGKQQSEMNEDMSSSSPRSLTLPVFHDLSALWSYGGDGRRWSSYLLFCHGKFGTATLMVSALQQEPQSSRSHFQLNSAQAAFRRNLTRLGAGDDSVTVYLYLMNMKMTMHADDFRDAFSVVDETMARRRAMCYLLDTCLGDKSARTDIPFGSQKRLRSPPGTSLQNEMSASGSPVASKRKKSSDAGGSPSAAARGDEHDAANATMKSRPAQPKPPLKDLNAVATITPKLIFSWSSSPLTALADSDNDERIAFPTMITRMVAVQGGQSQSSVPTPPTPSRPPVAPSSAASSNPSSASASTASSSFSSPYASSDSSAAAVLQMNSLVQLSDMSANDSRMKTEEDEKPTVQHLPQLKSQSHAFVSSPASAAAAAAAASAYAPAPPPPPSPTPVIELRCSAVVNGCYEQFFGEQQQVVRDDFIRLGFRAFYKRLDDSNMPQIQEKTIQAMFKAGERVFHCPVQCRTANGIRRRCMLYAKYCPTSGPQISCVIFTFIPLDHAPDSAPVSHHSSSTASRSDSPSSPQQLSSQPTSPSN